VITQFEVRLGAGSLFGNWFTSLWIARANSLIRDAVAIFGGHGSVISDRLHAHILACLMEIPNTIYDNSYGKNSRYISTWTAASPLVNLVAPSENG